MRHSTTILTLLFLLAIAVSPAAGFQFRSQDDIYLSGNYDDDFYLFGGVINIEVTTRGDIVAGGKTVTYDGSIDGNLIAAAQRVTVNGEVSRSVRTFAQYVTVSSRVDGDLISFGQEIIIASDAVIGNDCVAFGAEVILDGRVERNCKIAADYVRISGTVVGDLDIEAKKLVITQQAVVEGDLSYHSPARATIDPEAQIMGGTKWKKRARSSSGDTVSLPGLGPLFSILFMIGSLVIGAIMVLFNKQVVVAIAKDMRKNFLIHGLLGIVVICIAPILLCLVGITMVGIPLMVVGFSLYAIVFLIAKIFVGITLGMILVSLFKKEGVPSLGWSLLLGMVILALLFKIPYLGWFVYFVAWAVGAGAMTICFFRRTGKPLVNEVNQQLPPSPPPS